MPNLLPQLFSLKNLKYTKYSCAFQTLICIKIFGHPTKNQFLEVPICIITLKSQPVFCEKPAGIFTMIADLLEIRLHFC